MGNKWEAAQVEADDTRNVTLFEETMLPHLNAAYNLARWLTRNDEDAEDVVQESYVRGLRYFHGFTGGDGKAWLLAIVRNTFLTRRRRARNSLPFDERLHGSQFAPCSPEDDAIKSSSLRSLRTCLEGLPMEFRETIVMRELEELSYQEIADIASLPIGTVMSRLSRARRRLAECMAAKGEKS